MLLSVLDRKWREHLYEMDYLRAGIHLRAMANRDPVVEYQREGYDMFMSMLDGIKEESVGFLFNLEVKTKAQQDAEAQAKQAEAEAKALAAAQQGTARVLARRELDVFDAIHGIGEVGYHPKPDPRSFAAVLKAHALDPARCAMFEDDPRNLEVPFSLGMRTVLVGAGRHGPDELAEDHSHGSHVLWHTRDIVAFLPALAAALGAVASSQPNPSTAEADHEPH